VNKVKDSIIVYGRWSFNSEKKTISFKRKTFKGLNGSYRLDTFCKIHFTLVRVEL